MFAVGADWLCLDFLFFFYRLSFFFSLFLSLVDYHMYKLATRCSLSKFRHNVNMYDNVLILVTLFPRSLKWMKHGRTPSATESVHEKYVL